MSITKCYSALASPRVAISLHAITTFLRLLCLFVLLRLLSRFGPFWPQTFDALSFAVRTS